MPEENQNNSPGNYIPFDKKELVDFLISNITGANTRKDFKTFCSMVDKIYHDKLSGEYEKIESSYLSLDPDRNTIPIREYSKEKKGNDKKEVINYMRQLLKDAHYNEITKNDFQEALKKKSPWGLDLKINIEELSEYYIYYRNEYPDSRVKKHFLFFKKVYNFDVYSRVVLLFKFKEGKTGEKRKDNFLADKFYMKLFKNVPAVDVEMIFPNTKIKTSTFDKLMIFVPLAGGVIASIYQVFDFIVKQGSNVQVLYQMGFWGIIAGFFGMALRAFVDYQSKVEHYLKTLTSNLYFQNLDNNSGVYEYLLDNAEEEEVKEIVLGYYFLLINNRSKLHDKALDQLVESFFAAKFNKKIDFDINDSIKKLKNLGLIVKNKSYLEALPLNTAIKKLQKM